MVKINPQTHRGDHPAEESPDVLLTDTELLDLIVAAKNPSGYDDEYWPFRIETIDDVDQLVADTCYAIPAGFTHPILHICVWPNRSEPDALITLDLPSGLRLVSLPVEARQFINTDPDRPGTRANIGFALAELLYQAHRLTDAYDSAIAQHIARAAARRSPWWRRHGLKGCLAPAAIWRRLTGRAAA